jgi:hypothetical protein
MKGKNIFSSDKGREVCWIENLKRKRMFNIRENGKEHSPKTDERTEFST